MAAWPYGDPRWGKARLHALIRDGYACIICHRTRSDGVILDVDHIEPWTRRPDLTFDVSNLRTLCRLHHNRRTHSKPKRRHSRRW